MKQNNKQNKKGFTLLEMLVVILIIGILAAIALPQYQMAVKKAEFARLQPMTKALLDAEERYFLTNGTYTGIENLDIDMPGATYVNVYGSILANGSICSCNGNGQWLFCATKDKRNAYGVIPSNSNSYPWGAGKKYCGACSLDTEDKYNKFCQKMTNRTSVSIRSNWLIVDYYCQGNLYQFE